MTRRKARCSELSKRAWVIIDDILPIIDDYAKKIYESIRNVNDCSFWRHRGGDSGLSYGLNSYITLREPTAKIVVIHEILHYLSSKAFEDCLITGFRFWNWKEEPVRRWKSTGSALFNEAITERLALQILQARTDLVKDRQKRRIVKTRKICKRLLRPRMRCGRILLQRFFEGLAGKLNRSITEIEIVFYRGYFSHNFCEAMKLTDEAFGAGSFKALISNKNDEINKFERVVKKLCAQ